MKNLSVFNKTFWRLCITLLLAAAPAGAAAQAMITSVTPNPVCEGESVTVTHSGFNSITGLRIGTTVLSYVVINATQLRFTAIAVNPNNPWGNTLTLEGTVGAGNDSATATVTITPSPVISNLPVNATVCTGATYAPNPSVTPAGSSCSWTRIPSGYSSTTCQPTLPTTTAGTYTYTLTASSSGCTASSAVWLTVSRPVITSFPVSPNPCSGTNYTPSYSLIPSSGVSCTWAGPNSYSNNNCFPTIPVSGSAGTYTYTLTARDQNNCTASSSFTMNVRQTPSISGLAANVTICSGTVYSPVPTVTPASNATCSWTGPNNYTNSSCQPNIAVPTPAGTYTYTLTATNSGCTASRSVNVTVNPLPEAGNPVVRGVCAKEVLVLSAPNNASYSYQWSVAGNVFISPAPHNKPEVTFQSVNNQPATYEVRLVVRNNFGCQRERTDRITVNPVPELLEWKPKHKIFNSGDSVKIEITTLPSNAILEWRIDNPPSQIDRIQNLSGTQNPIVDRYTLRDGFSGKVSLTYTVTLTDPSSSCKDSFDRDVEVARNTTKKQICGDIPNIITPNGDNKNDKLLFRLLDGSGEDPYVQIFSYSGLKVWENYTTEDNGWEGKYSNGIPCPAGGYWYIASTSLTTCRGSVTLIR